MYKPLVIKQGLPRLLFGVFVLAASLALLGVSIWGIVEETTVGLGLEVCFWLLTRYYNCFLVFTIISHV